MLSLFFQAFVLSPSPLEQLSNRTWLIGLSGEHFPDCHLHEDLLLHECHLEPKLQQLLCADVVLPEMLFQLPVGGPDLQELLQMAPLQVNPLVSLRRRNFRLDFGQTPPVSAFCRLILCQKSLQLDFRQMALLLAILQLTLHQMNFLRDALQRALLSVNFLQLLQLYLLQMHPLLTKV